MNIITTETMINIDRETINNSLPSILLMETVAYDMFRLIEKKHKSKLKNYGINIFSGIYGNGGDGLAIARYFIKNKYKTNIFLVGESEKLKGDTLFNYNALKNMGVRINNIDSEDSVLEYTKKIKNKSLIIDSLFGIGLSREIDGFYKSLIVSLNKKEGCLKIAIDLPSGLSNLIKNKNAVCFKADETYTVALPKDIFFLLNTREYIGEIFAVASVFDKNKLITSKHSAKLITSKYIKNIKLNRSSFSSKREQGIVSIIAGSYDYAGAALLTASAVYGLGAGYIKLFVPDGISEIIKQTVLKKMPEVVVVSVGENREKYFTESALEKVLKETEKSNSVILGCGLSRDDETKKFVNKLIPKLNMQVVVDADALALLENNTLKNMGNNFVITPHIYEFQKISGIAPEETLNRPYQTLQNFREKTNANTLLKDSISFFMDRESVNEDIYVNYSPMKSMGKAGMGDVLAGFIGTFLARGLTIKEAVILSLFIQKNTFKLCSYLYGEDTVEPSHLAEKSGVILKKIKRAKH